MLKIRGISNAENLLSGVNRLSHCLNYKVGCVFTVYSPARVAAFVPRRECSRHFYGLVYPWSGIDCDRFGGKIQKGSPLGEQSQRAIARIHSTRLLLHGQENQAGKRRFLV